MYNYDEPLDQRILDWWETTLKWWQNLDCDSGKETEDFNIPPADFKKDDKVNCEGRVTFVSDYSYFKAHIHSIIIAHLYTKINLGTTFNFIKDWELTNKIMETDVNPDLRTRLDLNREYTGETYTTTNDIKMEAIIEESKTIVDETLSKENVIEVTEKKTITAETQTETVSLETEIQKERTETIETKEATTKLKTCLANKATQAIETYEGTGKLAVGLAVKLEAKNETSRSETFGLHTETAATIEKKAKKMMTTTAGIIVEINGKQEIN